MRCVVLQTDATATEEHVYWDEKLEENNEFPDRNHVGWPK